MFGRKKRIERQTLAELGTPTERRDIKINRKPHVDVQAGVRGVFDALGMPYKVVNGFFEVSRNSMRQIKSYDVGENKKRGNTSERRKRTGSRRQRQI